jgi:hypothetical protein
MAVTGVATIVGHENGGKVHGKQHWCLAS